MAALKNAAHLAERGLETLAGRRNTVRAARFLLDRARLDGPNNIESNGERLVQQFVLELDAAGAHTIIDVGAHFGEWSGHLLGQAQQAGLRPEIHLFEPGRFTFERLTEALGTTDGVRLNRQGVSSRSGTALLHKPHEGAGSSSLYDGASSRSGAEEISLTTLHEYCSEAGIDHVHLLKVDAEGHDLEVLEGARALLADRRVDIAQFEYNARWVDARRYLRDAFAFAESLGYRLGKVTPRGIEFYASWHPELESFREGNYILVRADIGDRMPAVMWWGP